jgi:hypothetical protein
MTAPGSRVLHVGSVAGLSAGPGEWSLMCRDVWIRQTRFQCHVPDGYSEHWYRFPAADRP